MSFPSWLQSLRCTPAPRRGQRQRRGSLRATTHRPNLEILEDRLTPSFSPPVAYPIDAAPPLDIVSADFNNDGHLDLATANTDANVSVFLGDGRGGFGAASQFGDGVKPRRLAAADFNNDGHLDLATANYFGGTVSVLLGNGDGTFRPPVQTATLPWPTAVAAADFNGDGNADLVYSSYQDPGAPVEVLLGDGWGGFAARHQYQTYTGGPGLAVADLNGDGRPDVVTANQGYNGTVSVLLGNGDGTLSYDFDSSNFATGGGFATDVGVGDFTSDGIPDLVTTDSDGWVAVLPGRGDGTFAAPILQYPLAGLWSAAADFNGDGRLDVLTVFGDPDSGSYSGKLFLGWGDGTFDAPKDVEIGGAPNGTPDVITTGDFNGDGRPDVAVGVSDWVGDAVTVLLNNGDWTPLSPSLRINDVTITEGNTGTRAATFTVTLSAASTQSITVAYATGNGTATTGSDYQAASGTLTFAPGETSKTITGLVNGDRLAEPNETFVVNLSSPTNATITDSQGVGTIVDDEPRISISDVAMYEGKKNQTTLFSFTVTLSAAYDQPVTMSFRTVDGTAKTGDNDYVAKTGTLTFKPGETSKTITIVVNGDSKKEANETFYLDLFGNSSNSLFNKKRGIGTILNDD